MKIAGIFLIVFGIALGIGGFTVAMKPSIWPLVTVIGAFAVPALCIYWGVHLLRRP